MRSRPVIACSTGANALCPEPRSETRSNHGADRIAHLSAYRAGWANADTDLIRSVVADDYIRVDPEEGCIAKSTLSAFVARFKSKIDRLRDGQGRQQYLVISDVVLDEGPTFTTGWWRFAVPGTNIEGVSHFRVGDKGVVSEHRAYWAKSRP